MRHLRPATAMTKQHVSQLRLTHVTTCAAALVAAGTSALAQGLSLTPVAYSGQTAPGTNPTEAFADVYRPTINRHGTVAFTGGTTGWPSQEGLWYGTPGSISAFVMAGTSAPGTSPSKNFRDFTIPNLNSNGQLLFLGAINAAIPDDVGLWSGTAGNLNLIARSGDPAPGTGSGVVFGDAFSDPSYTDANEVVFCNFIHGTGVTANNDTGIWAGSPGNLQLVAREGDAAAGFGSGVLYGDLFDDYPVMNHNGIIAFAGHLSGTGVTSDNNRAIWCGAPGSLVPLARTGDVPPDEPSSVQFQNIGHSFSGYSYPGINNLGHVTFAATLRDGSTIIGNGIWLFADGILTTLARTGAQAPHFSTGIVYDSILSEAAISDAGHVVFTGSVSGSGIDSTNNTVIWAGRPDFLRRVVREGDQAPGFSSGVVFSNISLYWPRINIRNQVVFYAALSGPGIDSTNSGTLWGWNRRDGLTLIAQCGDTIEVAPSDFRTIETIYLSGQTGNADGRISTLSDNGTVAVSVKMTDGSFAIFTAELPFTCPADWDRSGSLMPADIDAFYSDWIDSISYGPLVADFDGDGDVDNDDLTEFLQAHSTGC